MSISEQTRIEERTVTIKVVRVGSRQMTQTLFWQLPTRSIIEDGTGKLLGTLWGRVKITESSIHGRKDTSEQILWEDQGILYRCSLNTLKTNHQTQKAKREVKLSTYAHDFLVAECLHLPDYTDTYEENQQSEDQHKRQWPYSLIGEQYKSIRFSDSLVVSDVPTGDEIQVLLTYPSKVEKLRSGINETKVEWVNQRVQTDLKELTKNYTKARQTLKNLLLKTLEVSELPSNVSTILGKRIKDYHKAGQEIDVHWAISYQTLTESEQLFIGA